MSIILDDYDYYGKKDNVSIHTKIFKISNKKTKYLYLPKILKFTGNQIGLCTGRLISCPTI